MSFNTLLSYYLCLSFLSLSSCHTIFSGLFLFLSIPRKPVKYAEDESFGACFLKLHNVIFGDVHLIHCVDKVATARPNHHIEIRLDDVPSGIDAVEETWQLSSFLRPSYLIPRILCLRKVTEAHQRR